jgi:SAM-dependent methyltransferase
VSGRSSDDWDDLATWWHDEALADPAYATDVHPMLLHLVGGRSGIVLDLGCGDGQGMRLIGDGVIGTDLSLSLLAMASEAGPVVRSDLPDLSWVRPGIIDLAYAVYLVDLIEDHEAFFASCASAVREGGSLVVIINHPVYTAPGSAPLMDEDGEILWRWGRYFAPGSSLEPAGHRQIRYHHRSVADLLSAAARHGWCLDEMVERGLGQEAVARMVGFEGQQQVPRFLGVRWLRRSDTTVPVASRVPAHDTRGGDPTAPR